MTYGRHDRKGLRSYSVSGRVKNPGVKLAPAGITIQELIDEKKITKGKGEVIQFLLRNVIKYNNYNFDKDLINIVPPKFR